MNTTNQVARPLYAYVGSYTTAKRHACGEGISVFSVDPATGGLTLIQTVQTAANPSYLAINRQGNRLYCVHGDGHEVSVLQIDPNSGTLQLLQRQECGGHNPVHLALDPQERFLVVSDHLGNQGGTVAVLPVHDNGTLGEVCQRVALPGAPGPHRHEQPFAKPHANPFSPNGRFVVVPDKGLDQLFTFRFDQGRLEPADPPSVPTRTAAGPRHMAFHPGAPYAYVINELDSTVAAYRFDAEHGALTPFQILSSLPDTYTGNNQAAGIAISRDGRTLYASNRGDDSIAVFGIDPHTGRLSFIEATPSQGRTPRFFTLSPDGDRLYALNENSNNIAIFDIDPHTGRLTQHAQAIACGSPVCLVFGPSHIAVDNAS